MDVNILTNTLTNFLTALSGGYLRLQGDALTLMRYLVVIEIVFFGVFSALGMINLPATALKKITLVGLFIWIVQQSPRLSGVLLDSFTQAGILAGGSPITRADILNPSGIIDIGFRSANTIRSHLSLLTPIDSLLYVVCMCVLLLAFFFIAWNIFLTIVEFYLFTICAVILIPFGVSRATSWLAERAIGGAFTMGFKMMVLSFIVSLSFATITGLILPADPTFEQIISTVCTAGVIALLCWHAPNLLAGYIGGAPSLNVSHVTSGAMSPYNTYSSFQRNSDHGSVSGRPQMAITQMTNATKAMTDSVKAIEHTKT